MLSVPRVLRRWLNTYIKSLVIFVMPRLELVLHNQKLKEDTKSSKATTAISFQE
jgi:hypothetical protein